MSQFRIADKSKGTIFKLFLIFFIFLSILIWGNYVLVPIFIFSGFVFTFSFYFYRDPDRILPKDGDYNIIAPADGKILIVDRVSDNRFPEKEALQVSIFMNVFNVHVNRFPVSGNLFYKQYRQGKFLAAWNHKASTDNEQLEIGIRTAQGDIYSKQIAGLVARRIVSDVKVGDVAEIGNRYGLIKFGSRVDLLMPLSTRIDVQKGDLVKAGESIIGKL